jgi:hypothetical protein
MKLFVKTILPGRFAPGGGAAPYMEPWGTPIK